jgi:hypothetical protein
MERVLCTIVLSKIMEQVERTDHLIGMLPEGRLDWAPAGANAWPTGILLGHLLECCAGFCAVLLAVEPERLRHFQELRELAAHQGCDPRQARERIALYAARIREGFELLRDPALPGLVPTVFVPRGEPLLTLLLGNLEHLVNHKHQLYMYLRLMGVTVGSADLYRFRGLDFVDTSPHGA